MGESISEFMKRRAREVARLGREAEAAAHHAYGKAIRAGQDLKLRSPGEVMREGAGLLQKEVARSQAAVKTLADKATHRIGAAVEQAGRDPVLKPLAVGVAQRAGNAAGLVRGGVHAVQGVADAAVFATRLANPLDRAMSPEGQSAGEQLQRAVEGATRATVDYVAKAVADPRIVVNDAGKAAGRWNRELNPAATPAAPTLAGELRRNFDIGQNQGELLFDVGSLVVGGPAATAVKGVSRAGNVGNVAKYIAQGHSPRAAAHLAEVYPTTNMGSHFIARRTRLPELLGGGPLPHEYLDGPFNKLIPPGISRGDLYELHYSVDPHFHGTSVLRERWSGRDLGLKRHGPLGRLWHGSPAPLKARVGGLGASAGNAMYAPASEEMTR